MISAILIRLVIKFGKSLTFTCFPLPVTLLQATRKRKPGYLQCHQHFSVYLAKLGSLTRDFFAQNCPSLFKGLGVLGQPVNLDLDPSIKPTHAPQSLPTHPISNLESIKAALDIYEATGQLMRVSQPTKWIFNPHQTRIAADLFRPLSDPKQGNTSPKVNHSHARKEPS